MKNGDKIAGLLVELYGHEDGGAVYLRLQSFLERYENEQLARPKVGRAKLTQRDAILITYGDQVFEPGRKPLATLVDFCQTYLQDVISGIHILPFFPYSSDDGFSVIDYLAVNPRLGSWDDILDLGKDFRLMFDLVLNHISTHSRWFESYLRGDPKYSHFFIEVEGDPDLSQVVRPRALPLLTRFETSRGIRQVWTTFSTDQVDLNYHDPEVLLAIIAVILFYASQGAEFLRLDAIAYLWKELGTTCIHLPQTHLVIRLFRAILDAIYPQVSIITETNVPHRENISYFGDGTDEAQLVYNFALPPLVLHTLQTGSAKALARWAAGIELPSHQVTFYNFLASHDGIGLNPVRGILGEAEIKAIVERVEKNGGLVSYKQNPDGSQSPYELNINYFDAVTDAGETESEQLGLARFIVCHAIMLALSGVPGIYFHSLFGSRGWFEGVELTGRNRTINRQKFDLLSLEAVLKEKTSRQSRVFSRFVQMLSARSSSAAFDPAGRQQVLPWGDSVFGLLRASQDEKDQVLCLHNVTGLPQTVRVDWDQLSAHRPDSFTDLLSGEKHAWPGQGTLNLQPYQVAWLKLSWN